MHDIVSGSGPQPGGEARIEGGGMLRAGESRDEAGIVQQLGQARQGEKPLVLILLAHGQGPQAVFAGIDGNRVSPLIAV
jgi:hypothetical protein